MEKETHPIKQLDASLAAPSARKSDPQGDVFVAHAEDIQPRIPDVPDGVSDGFDPDPAVLDIPGKAMREAQEATQVPPLGELDETLLATIREMAGGDRREERRLIRGAKQSATLRAWLRHPGRYSLSVPAPKFTSANNDE